MSSRSGERPTVLVADDEQHLADLYSDYLSAEYDVVTAYGGEQALDALDDESQSVDVAILDRRMPETSGDEVLATITEGEYECRVAMVTAVYPGFDIIDMGCDEYLVKPVSRENLLDVVDRLLKLSEYSEKHRELTSKRLTRNVLKVEKSAPELAESDRYNRLESEIEDLESELDDISEDLDLEELQRQL